MRKIVLFDEQSTRIPTYWAGDLRIQGNYVAGIFKVPLATAEKPLIPSVCRGAKATHAYGIHTIVEDFGCSRAPVLRAPTARTAAALKDFVEQHFEEFKAIAESTTHHGKLRKIESTIVGRELYLRVDMFTGDAAGHNMTTKAAYAIVSRILDEFSGIELISLSGNYCTDKKVSAVNSIAGRGKKVIAETILSLDACVNILKTTPNKIITLNHIKNYQGSIVAGSICSANAHYANMLAAFYLATGQDVANIVEGSQGITCADIVDNNLYFSVTLPNIIVGTVGGGTALEDQSNNLRKLGCYGTGKPIGCNSLKLAEIIGATVLAGELSLMAALTNNDELIRAHDLFERKRR